MRVNSGAGVSFTSVRFSLVGDLSGTGTLRLDAGQSLDTAYLEAIAPTGLITHRSPHTIAGAGRLYGALINESAIVADTPGKVLEGRGSITQAPAELSNRRSERSDWATAARSPAAASAGRALASFELVGARRRDHQRRRLAVLDNSTLRIRGGGIVNTATVHVNNAGNNLTRLRAEVPTLLTGKTAR